MKTLVLKSCLGSAAATLVVAFLLPKQLVATADIIGIPVFYNFNAPRLLQRYWLLVAFFPAVSFVLFEILSRRRLAGRPRRQDADVSHVTRAHAGPRRILPNGLASATSPVSGLAPVAFVGWILSLGCAGKPFLPSTHYVLQSSALILVYTACVVALSAVMMRMREGRSFRASVSVVNTAGAWLAIPALFAVSRASSVLTSTGVVQSWPFFPWPVFVVLATTAGWIVIAAWRKARDESHLFRIERKTVYLCALPVAVFLTLARLPSEVGDFDLFHAGETVASAYLVSSGYFPWRDILFVHGLFEDPGKSWLSFALFGTTIWGSAAGQTLLLTPLTWVSAYYLYLALFPRTRLMVVLGGLLLPLVIPAPGTTVVTRYVFLPWVALSFVWMLRRPSIVKAVVFGALLFLQTLLVPDLTLAVPGFMIALILFELRRSGPSGLRRFTLTPWVVATGILLTAVLAIWLLRHDALRGFVDYYRLFGFGSGYLFWGSHGIEAAGAPYYYVRLIALIAAFVAGLWWFFLALRLRWRLAPHHYLALALLLVGIVYFQKFLGRPDDAHLHQVGFVSAPIVAYMLERAFRGRVVFSGVLLALMIVAAAPALVRITDTFPQRISRSAHPVDGSLRLGYAEESTGIIETIRALQPVISSADADVFDFTNEPALFYFLLDAKPRTPFFHVAMAISRKSQARLIENLAERPPPLVAYFGDDDMWHWDGIPNSVRHRDVSEYLLRHWEPVSVVASHLFLRRKDSRGPPAMDVKVYRTLRPCDWGYVPHFDRPPDVRFRELGSLLPRTEVRSGAVRTILSGIDGREMPLESLHRASYLEFSFDDLKADRLGLHDGDDTWSTEKAPIAFNSLPDGRRTYYLQVGACPQWYAFSAGHLVLLSKHDHKLIRVRLLGK